MKLRHGPGNGSHFSAVNPEAFTASARYTFFSMLSVPLGHPFAYTFTRSRDAPPRILYSGCPAFFATMSHSAISIALHADIRSSDVRRIAKPSNTTCAV